MVGRLLLAANNYTIEYILEKDNAYADYLSRKPVQGRPSPKENVSVQILFIEGEQVLTSSMIMMETRKVPILSKVLQCTKEGQEKLNPNSSLTITSSCNT